MCLPPTGIERSARSLDVLEAINVVHHSERTDSSASDISGTAAMSKCASDLDGLPLDAHTAAIKLINIQEIRRSIPQGGGEHGEHHHCAGSGPRSHYCAFPTGKSAS
jgi:hypothetical protein